MNFSIIVRTHDVKNLHGERYTGTDKAEVTYRSLYSLVQSINYAFRPHGILGELTPKVNLIILDDHSLHPETIKDILARASYPASFEPLEDTGNNASCLRSFEVGKGAEGLVYFVEDDYLHEESAIEEMFHDWFLFSKNLGCPVALNPYDDPDNYLPNWIELTRVVHGLKRHWRTNVHSLGTFLIHTDAVRAHWKLFEDLALYYEKVKGITEDSTIGKMWRQEIPLFSPIPSLALHMQTEHQKDPYIRWEDWWEKADYNKTA